MRTLAQRFKPFKLTVTNNPDTSSVFEFVPVQKHKRGHTVRQDQPLRLGYLHEDPIERLFLLEGEYGNHESLMLSEEAKGSMRLQIPLSRLRSRLDNTKLSYHGAIVRICSKEAKRYLSLTVRTSQERVFTRFRDIKRKILEKKRNDRSRCQLSPDMLDLRTVSNKASFSLKSGIIHEQKILTERINRDGANTYTLVFNHEQKGSVPGLLWQIIFMNEEEERGERGILIVKVWLRHLIHDRVIGPLLMHFKKFKKPKDITVRFQTDEEEGRFINVDGELSKKSEQFQFTKLVSLKTNEGRISPTESLTLIQADQQNIRVAQFLSSVHRRIKEISQDRGAWNTETPDQALKLIQELKDFLTNSRSDLLDKNVRMNRVSPLHQEILRESHTIRSLLMLYEALGERNLSQKAQFHRRPALVRMLRQLIELIRCFINNSGENIKEAVIYFIPLLMVPNNFREFPKEILQVIQIILSQLSPDLFESVERSILLFLRNLLNLLDERIQIYSQLTVPAKIELIVTFKAYARVLELNHREDSIQTYFRPFVLRESNHPEIITNQFHYFYTKTSLAEERKEQEALIEQMFKIDSPEFIREQLFFYSEIYSAFLIFNKRAQGMRLARLIEQLLEISDQREDQNLRLPVLCGLIRIMRHSVQTQQLSLQRQPVLLRIEVSSQEIKRQNEIFTPSKALNKEAELQAVLNLNSFMVFEKLKLSIPYFVFYKEKEKQNRQSDLQDLAFSRMISKYHIEIMKMYNSVLLQPGLIAKQTQTHLLSLLLDGYLGVCQKWIETMGSQRRDPFDQKQEFPKISPLELQILKMKIESEFKEMKENQKEYRCLTQGVESIRNYLNRIEACYEEHHSYASSKNKLDEGSVTFMKRLLSNKANSDLKGSGHLFMVRQDDRMKFYNLQEEAWEEMISFFNIILDIDSDSFLDEYAERQRNVETKEDCHHFVKHSLPSLLETPSRRFHLIDRIDRIALIIESLLSWLPFIRDPSILRKNLTLISRLTNQKQELRSLMIQSTFLSKQICQGSKVEAIQNLQENLLEIDNLVRNQVTFWKNLLSTDFNQEDFNETNHISNRSERREDDIERLTSLLESVKGFFTMMNGDKSTSEALAGEQGREVRIASRIFRVIKGHEVILNLVVSMKDLLSQALLAYSPSNQLALRRSEVSSRLSREIPRIYTSAFNIIGKFSEWNAENKEIMVNNLLGLLPTYGAMFQIALYNSRDELLTSLHNSFVEMFISIFRRNSYIVYASQPIIKFMEKFNLRVVSEKFTISCKIYAEILENSSDPLIFDLAFSHLKAIKRNLDEAVLQRRLSLQRRRTIKLQPETLKWKELSGCLQKMLSNLESPSFKVIRIKFEDFFYILRAQIKQGFREAENNRTHEYLDIYPASNYPSASEREEGLDSESSRELIEQQPLLNLHKESHHQESLEEEISRLILLSPELESIVLRERDTIYAAVFAYFRKKKNKCFKKRHKDTLIIPRAKQTELKGFFSVRDNRKEVLHSKLLYYISKIIQILEVKQLFEVSSAEEVRRLIQEIYFLIKEHPRVAVKLQTRVVGLIAHFFVSGDSISLQTLIPILLEFANFMLNNGSRTVQERFYDFFKETHNANIFSHINTMIRRQVYSISTKQDLLLKNALFVRNREFQDLMLKDPANESLFFLKSLCENHHARFQKFIRDQDNESKNYDMIDLTVDFLLSHLTLIQSTYFRHKKDKLRVQIQRVTQKSSSSILLPLRNESSRSKKSNKQLLQRQRSGRLMIENLALFVDNVLTALLAIIEYVQGPCLQNQSFLMHSSFLHCAELLFREFHFTFAEDLSRQANCEISNLNLLEMKSQCALALRSIVEGRSSFDSLSKAIKTEITIRDIEYLIAYTYYAYSLLNTGVYVLDEQYFGRQGALHWYRLEAGFNFYFLLRSYSDESYLTAKSYGDQNMVREDTKVKGVCQEVGEIFREVFNCKKGEFIVFKRMAPLELLSKRRFLTNYEGYFRNGLHFFKHNSAQIEIHQHDGRLETVYFPKAPSYNTITHAQKENLIFNLSADSDSVKVDSIMRKGTELIQEMDRRYFLRTMFLKIPVIGIFFAHFQFWNLCAFWLSIVLNFLIIFSYSEYPRRDDASLLIVLIGDRDPTADSSVTQQQEDLIDYTHILFCTLGIFLLFFIVFGNLLLVFESCSKHYQRSKTKRLICCRRCRKHQSGRNCERLLMIVWGLVFDYVFIYTMLYLIFGFLGVAVHPYYFAFHISAIFRLSPDLQNILKAVWRPRKELFFTLIIFMMTEYIFALFIYQFYKDDVKNNHCISLATCILTVLDQTFKVDGGVGSYLDQGSQHLVEITRSLDYPGTRVLFHQLFNFLVLILLVQVMAAILIDTFGKMRQEKNNIAELVTSTCLICGRERDEIERKGEDFDKHVKVSSLSDWQIRHNMFHYIQFIAYLKKKNPIDYTGAESYVYQLYTEQNLRWFPIYKGRSDRISLFQK